MDAGTRTAVLRRLGLDHNAMRRRSDRVESTVLVAVLLLGLLAVPVAAAVASSVAGRTGAVAAAVDARTTPVTARTLADATGSTAPGGTLVPVRVPVGWSRDGVPYRARTWVPQGTRAGTAVVVRVDATGDVVEGPTAGDAVGVAAAAGIGVLVSAWALLLTVLVATRLLLDRTRMRAWGAEWEEIEPPWRREQI